MTAALFYHPEAYTTGGPKLMGRHAAGESFLRGFLRYSQAEAFWVQVIAPEHARDFARRVAAQGRVEPVKAVDKTGLGALARAGTLYLPGPGLGEHAFHRAAFAPGAWSLCGITHTTSSARAMDALTELVTAPVQPWDAVICTSAAVRSHVVRLLQAQVDYLRDRLGLTKWVPPQLPVIPLGVHVEDFAFTAAQREASRRALGVAADTLVVLYIGRLSFHAKAHPLAMYQVLEAAARQTGQRVVLVECGWHANAAIARAFADAARLACPSVRVVTLDGRQAGDRQTAWAGADLFCSLSDNLQETFGITPVEAMAAGLPVVVSDWDGYRDTVRDGLDGFRVPTLMPAAGQGQDLAWRHALEIETYDLYCGHACMLVAVDIPAATQAFARLLASPELRRRMGDAGRERARAVYDWSQIIPRYEALWAELRAIRQAEAPKYGPLRHPWPARLEPFHAFGSYPSRVLSPRAVLGLADADADAAMARLLAYRQLAMVDFARAVLPTEEEVRAVLEAAGDGPRTATALIAGLPAGRQPFIFRSLTWLLKLGVLKLCE